MCLLEVRSQFDERSFTKIITQTRKEAKINLSGYTLDTFQVAKNSIGTWCRINIFPLYILELLVTQRFSLLHLFWRHSQHYGLLPSSQKWLQPVVNRMKCSSNKLHVESLSQKDPMNDENRLKCSKQMRGDSQIWSVKSKVSHTAVPCLAAFLRYVVLMIDFYSGSLD